MGYVEMILGVVGLVVLALLLIGTMLGLIDWRS